MKKLVDEPLKIAVIHPGENLLRTGNWSLETLLGSCVAVTLWHQAKQLGGLCHFLLDKPHKECEIHEQNKYGEYALANLFEDVCKKVSIDQCRIAVFGGSHLFDSEDTARIGARNIFFAESWLDNHGLTPYLKDLGGHYCRKIKLSTRSGKIDIQRYQQVGESLV